MGNRAVITFDQKPTSKSIGIYLHWNGGPESVLAFIEAANHFKVRIGDDSYELARIVQIISNYFGGTTSIGVGTMDRLDTDNGDNGVYSVQRNGAVKIRQSRDGRTGWKTLDLEKIRKHAYWQKAEGRETILENIINANKAAFAEKDE